MRPSPLLLALLLVPPAARAAPAADLDGLPTPVREYVAGWLARDGARVDQVVSDLGGYRDPGLWSPLSGPDLADYVETFRTARLELLEVRRPDAEHVDLAWTLTWPDARGTQRFTDHLTVRDGRIQHVVSEGPPIPAGSWPVIEAYFRNRGEARAAETAALFGADGVLEAKNLPAGGIRGERLRQYFEADVDRRLIMREGGLRQLTKDGRPAVDFHLLRRSDGGLIAGGRELFTIEKDRIVRLTGLF